MITMGVISVVIIIYSSFRFNNKQQLRFRENLAESDSLTIKYMRLIGEADSVRISDFKGKKSVMVFWASWSEKSELMLGEIEKVQFESDSLQVIAALVKDAEESLPEEKTYPTFIYTDGTELFNDLKVPGYPSYIVFGEDSDVINSQVGYQKGVGYDSLKIYLND
jgi:thiol-disulfide isomerase/thioredoxin